jgi:hypothetical protein
VERLKLQVAHDMTAEAQRLSTMLGERLTAMTAPRDAQDKPTLRLDVNRQADETLENLVARIVDEVRRQIG